MAAAGSPRAGDPTQRHEKRHRAERGKRQRGRSSGAFSGKHYDLRHQPSSSSFLAPRTKPCERRSTTPSRGRAPRSTGHRHGSKRPFGTRSGDKQVTSRRRTSWSREPQGEEARRRQDQAKEKVPLPPFRVRVKRPLPTRKRFEAVIKINPDTTSRGRSTDERRLQDRGRVHGEGEAEGLDPQVAPRSWLRADH